MYFILWQYYGILGNWWKNIVRFEYKRTNLRLVEIKVGVFQNHVHLRILKEVQICFRLFLFHVPFFLGLLLFISFIAVQHRSKNFCTIQQVRLVSSLEKGLEYHFEQKQCFCKVEYAFQGGWCFVFQCRILRKL
eukprot:TRINITY_DN9202_c0_g1_i3.p4 TRINITY_DN9202_c0_g1~~TRINITY_DN9202_c0_g1_i3.p4  ORF type:complete len:134 (-),score=1.72 TRINITY_DN9202_c0_g1_i3:419-820(-)